jgi:predicted Rossmann fold flavoprotein
MAAARLAGEFQVTVFESGPRPGRKLLLSGGGQCNITHTGEIADFLTHYGKNGKFLKTALYAFPPKALLDFFRQRGLDFLEREDGKIFPKTLKARDVLDKLLAAGENAAIMSGEKVTGINKKADVFILETEKSPRASKKTYEADKVILATGGLSYPETGSGGSGFSLALGHRITPLRPALCGVISPGFKDLAGNSFTAAGIAVFRAGRLILRGEGDILFTHRGVSGPAVLNLSRYLEAGDTLAINFLHPTDPEEFLAAFPGTVKKEERKTIGGFLSAFPLTRALQDVVLARNGVPRSKPCAQLTKTDMRKIAEHLVRFPVPVVETEGFHAAMVTAGGVSLDEVNPKTMESRVTAGLYFAGEILDIDGDEGGYNLQAAFSTGWLAAASILYTSTSLS